MRRRRYLQSVGLVMGGLAGCLENEPEAANEFDYYTHPKDGVDVPLVPVEDSYDWYQNGETVFVDTRGEISFERARIAGSVLSPAPDGQESDDPIGAIGTDRRIVTYCECPHHLATLRGASLIRDGYIHTYAIMEGFDGWRNADYPQDGSNVAETRELYTINGRTDPAFAGEFAWVWHDQSGQREAAPIDNDGTFTLHVRFYDIGSDSLLRLEAPRGSATRPLAEFADQEVKL